jgi:hypothetical protein
MTGCYFIGTPLAAGMFDTLPFLTKLAMGRNNYDDSLPASVSRLQQLR